MPLFTLPSAFRNRDHCTSWAASPRDTRQLLMASNPGQQPLPPHSSHPALPYLTMLIVEAVLEVVCVSLPGYIVARQGLFTAEMQKFTANLNIALFTPCLIFTKLASQLTVDTIIELAVIPLIFIVQTAVSFCCSWAVTKAFGFSRRPRNFVIAMGVFGNSNSLPISLVLSLSQTIKGLHWSKVPGDNDDEVGTRGILYLLIFQQLGQLVRWSWGYNVLLAPAHKFEKSRENTNSRLENGTSNNEHIPLLDDSEEDSEDLSGSEETQVELGRCKQKRSNNSDETTPSGDQTPVNHYQKTSSASSSGSIDTTSRKPDSAPELLPTTVSDNYEPANANLISSTNQSASESVEEPVPEGLMKYPARCRNALRRQADTVSAWLSRLNKSMKNVARRIFTSLPITLQTILAKVYHGLTRFCLGVWSFMNPPLWAMLAAILVASIPELQRFFFTDGTFFNNSVTSAIRESGGVAIPLILVVLGGNLARNTLPSEHRTREDDKEETRLLIASLISRMVLPTLVMAPLLAVTAKFAPVGIFEDPIFVIVCFLVAGAPTALQLAQICQINEVYMGAMSRLLFQSYVVWILPSTLVLVMCALEVVEWAHQ